MYALIINSLELPATVYTFPDAETALTQARKWYARLLWESHDADKDLSAYPNPETATIEEISSYWSDGTGGWWIEIDPVEETIYWEDPEDVKRIEEIVKQYT